MNARDKNDRAAWLEGPTASCCAVATAVGRPWRLVLLGPPGVGKGTQAALLSQRLGACHLSTGDVFRAARDGSQAEPTPAMAEALAFMRRGHLVADETVWEIVRERITCLRCPGGFVLDGFPRTLAQAESLSLLLEEECIPLDAVVSYALPVAEMVSRLSGRRTCEKCRAIFHILTAPAREKDVCDHCGGRLYQREDDRPQSIAVRLEDYEHSTAPLIRFYLDLGLLTPVMAAGSPEQVFARAYAALEGQRNTG